MFSLMNLCQLDETGEELLNNLDGGTEAHGRRNWKGEKQVIFASEGSLTLQTQRIRIVLVVLILLVG